MDPYLAQIMGAAPQVDQMQQGDQQLADLIMRRRAAAAQPASTGGGALLGGIADMIMGNKENALRQQHMDLANQMAQRRGQWSNDLMSASAPIQAPPDMLAAPGYDQATQDRQQQQKLSALKMQGMLSGDPLINSYLDRAPGMELKGLEALAERQKIKQTEAMNPLAVQAEQQKVASQGPQAALGGQIPSVYDLLTKREGVSKYAVNPVSGRIYDTRTGQETEGSGGPGAALTDKRLPKMQEAFAKDFDPNISRGGLPKENQQRVNAADRIYALAVSKDPLTGQEVMNNLTPQQMTELATSSAALLAGGGGDAGTRHEMTPYTKGRTWAEVVQWLTDAPHGAGQQDFVKNMVDMARREQGVAQNQIRASQQSRLTNHLGYYSLFPDQAKAQMQGYGWDPSQVDFKTGKYTAKAPAPAAQGPAQAARPQRTVNGETREWDGKAWVPIGH